MKKKFKKTNLKVKISSKIVEQIPVYEIGEGEKTIAITAGVHGNEINGIELAHQFMHRVNKKDINGRLLIVPVSNISGYLAHKRQVQHDNKDLNRQFPGKSNGSASEKIAKEIYDQVLSKAEAVIDLHDAGMRSVLLPHVRVHGSVDNLDDCVDGCTVEMGSMFGTDIMLLRKGEKGMMAIENYKLRKKPVLTVEIGGQSIVWPEYIQQGLRGVKNVLKFFGVMEGKISLPQKQFILDTRDGWQAPMTGNLLLNVSLGQRVKKGELIAEIHDPIRVRREKIVSKKDGVVFSVNIFGKVKKDDHVATLLTYHEAYHQHSEHCELLRVIKNKPSRKIEIRQSKVMY